MLGRNVVKKFFQGKTEGQVATELANDTTGKKRLVFDRLTQNLIDVKTGKVRLLCMQHAACSID